MTVLGVDLNRHHTRTMRPTLHVQVLRYVGNNSLTISPRTYFMQSRITPPVAPAVIACMDRKAIKPRLSTVHTATLRSQKIRKTKAFKNHKTMKFAFSLVPMTAAAALLHHGLPAAAAASGAAEAKVTAPSLLRGGAASSGPGGGLRGPSLELARGSGGAADAGRNLEIQQQACWSATSVQDITQVPCDSLSGCYDGVDYLADTQADAINEGISYCGTTIHNFMTYSTGDHPGDDGRPWNAQCCSD